MLSDHPEAVDAMLSLDEPVGGKRMNAQFKSVATSGHGTTSSTPHQENPEKGQCC
jgi:hypothetical protein